MTGIPGIASSSNKRLPWPHNCRYPRFLPVQQAPGGNYGLLFPASTGQPGFVFWPLPFAAIIVFSVAPMHQPGPDAFGFAGYCHPGSGTIQQDGAWHHRLLLIRYFLII